MADNELPVDLPDQSGVRARRWRGLDDIDGMAAAVRSDNFAHGVEEALSAEAMRSHYSNMSNCDPERDIVVLEHGGEIIGYGRTTWRQRPEGGWSHYVVGAVHADHQHQGLGSAVLRYLEDRIRINGPAAGSGPHIADGFVDGKLTAKRRMFDHLDYAVTATEVDMIRPNLDDIPEATLPKGLMIRQPDGTADLRRVYDAHVEAFRDHFGFTEPTENDFKDFLDFEFSDPSLWRVAWDGEHVAGQVRSFIDEKQNETFGRKRGYTEFISTVRPWRRKGVARALLCESLRAIRDRGMTEASLGVHTDNPHNALTLYESAGFSVVGESWTMEKTIVA